jgi:hypothetical protein
VNRLTYNVKKSDILSCGLIGTLSCLRRNISEHNPSQPFSPTVIGRMQGRTMLRWIPYLALACLAWAMLTHSVLAADPILRIETDMHTARISDAATGRGGIENVLFTVSDDKTARV